MPCASAFPSSTSRWRRCRTDGKLQVPTVAVAQDEAESQRRSLTLATYRAFDLAIATLAAIASLPLLVIICVVIRLEGGGPAIFRQCRLGRDKRPFMIHKFRTMRAQADPTVHREYVARLIAGEETAHADGSGRDLYKLADDDRVTRVGRLLRKTSLDELPQIFDVLRGHMSLVGPRPVIPYEAALYPAVYDRRFAVKPGMTGYWQVNGRNERTYHEMVELDVAWVERHSVGLYLSIVVRTPWVLLRRRGAA
jgi:lipopolysaccharide/colanic/teichoic acid biosynthesis glycosyltransferase